MSWHQIRPPPNGNAFSSTDLTHLSNKSIQTCLGLACLRAPCLLLYQWGPSVITAGYYRSNAPLTPCWLILCNTYALHSLFPCFLHITLSIHLSSKGDIILSTHKPLPVICPNFIMQTWWGSALSTRTSDQLHFLRAKDSLTKGQGTAFQLHAAHPRPTTPPS